MTPVIIGLNEVLNQFVANLKSKKRSSATILAYHKDLSQLMDFLTKEGKNSLLEVKTADLEAFLKKLAKDFTPKTISRKINALKTFYRFLLAEKFVPEDISVSITHPKYENQPLRILSRIEYRALRDACREDPRIAAVVEILLQTGIRISELARLKMEDIKDKILYIKAYENHGSRELPLNRAVKTAILHYLDKRPKTPVEATLFITKNKRPFLVRNIRSTLARYFKKAGIKDASVNDLRHTFIYYQLVGGAPVSLLSKLVGHKRLTTTKKYLDLVKDKIKEKNRLEVL